ncbi:hypothetical protein [Methylomonas sp. AM2-LC]|uniref:hypothetical protein n=1 Tax=Methylomonas sp. AM2-LC TaxID=3153301 RepID=UPI003265ACB8
MLKEICKKISILLLLTSFCSQAKDGRYVLIYNPDHIKNSSFSNIVSSFESNVQGALVIETKSIDQSILNLISSVNPEKILVSSRSLIDELKSINNKTQLFATGFYFNSDKYNGVSLKFEGKFLIEKLFKSIRGIKKIYVVEQNDFNVINKSNYLNDRVEWKSGSDMVETIRIIYNIIDSANQNDAIIIPANLPSNMLYEITKAAWKNRIVLISTSINQLESGVLIAIYPNVNSLSEQITKFIQQDKIKYESVENFDIALNKRVSQHLDIQVDATLVLE